VLTETTIPLLAEVPVGTYTYPDQSATLVIGCRLGAGRQLRLTGPGIASAVRLRIDGIPEAFWPLRDHACRYPLGWDVVLVSGDQVAGLPRTTHAEVE